MSRRTPNGAVDSAMQEIGKKEGGAQEKQVRLLAQDNGHFSMARCVLVERDEEYDCLIEIIEPSMLLTT